MGMNEGKKDMHIAFAMMKGTYVHTRNDVWTIQLKGETLGWCQGTSVDTRRQAAAPCLAACTSTPDLWPESMLTSETALAFGQQCASPCTPLKLWWGPPTQGPRAAMVENLFWTSLVIWGVSKSVYSLHGPAQPMTRRWDCPLQRASFSLLWPEVPCVWDAHS